MTKNVGVRITEEDYNLVSTICMSRGEDVSDFVRRAIKREFARLGYLSSDVVQALGLIKIEEKLDHNTSEKKRYKESR